MNNKDFNPSITCEQALETLISLKPYQKLTVPLLFELEPEDSENKYPTITPRLVLKALANLPPSNLLYLNNLLDICLNAEIDEELSQLPKLDEAEPDYSNLDDIPILDEENLKKMVMFDPDEIDDLVNEIEADCEREELKKLLEKEEAAKRDGTYVDPNDKSNFKVPLHELTLAKAFMGLEPIIEASRSKKARFDRFDEDNSPSLNSYYSMSNNPLVQFILEKLDMSVAELLIFDICLSYAIKGRHCDMEDITSRYKLHNMAGLELLEVIDNLLDRGLLLSEDGMRTNFHYTVSKDVIMAISRNQVEKIPRSDKAEEISMPAFIKKIRDKFKNASRSSCSISRTYDSLRILRNRTLETFKFWDIMDDYTVKEQMLLLCCFDCFIINDNVFNINNRSYDFLTNGEESFNSWNFEEEVKALKIYEDGLIEESGDTLLEEESFSICLTDKGVQLFFQDATPIQYSKKKNKRSSNLIYPNSLVKKDLYYPLDIRPQIDDLLKILNKDNTLRLSTKLTEMGFKTGITVLLSGAPGTGKSESVYQIAKLTDRPIFMIDISTIKDKWVGESEKNVKQIFKDYERARKSCDFTPILLLNEADALLGRRINVERSVDQMNNSMQNIFLQCLEDFNGILMATTNLVGNLDTAFDRRFLFKIKFQTPNEEVRRQIWLSHFSQEQLAPILDKLSQIALSGGEIANCVKRYQLELLLDRANSIESLLTLAEGETSVRKTNSIGFNK